MDNKTAQIGNWFLDQLAVYQTANSDYQSVKNNFIIRTAEYSIITDTIASKKANDPLQHELILGRRGSGKSTLLKRIEIEIVENPKLNKRHISINLAEEQAGIYRLFDLWEQVIDELNRQHHFKIELPNYDSFDNDLSYTRQLYRLIHNICSQHKKRLILLLDNFDRIVENFTDDGSLLRETLINYNDILIIAASTRMDEHFWQYDLPFYNFFRTHKLGALSREEMNLLLTHWSNLLNIESLKEFVKNNLGKIENIRILTDGLPRTLQFFIQMVLQDSKNNTYNYLKKTMDNVSPLYQERLNSLTPQLKKIVYEMAFIWEACSTKKLVKRAKMESKLISANLKTLVGKGIVDKIETNKKQHLYRISERFFNMWLIVTQGSPYQKRKAKWLSIFLENWYDAKDFKKLASEHIASLKSGNTNWDNALLLSKGLSQSKYISTTERDTIIELTQNIKDKTIENCLIELPEKYSNILAEIIKYREEKKYSKAIAKAESIENEKDGVKFFILAKLYTDQQKYEEAERYYLRAIEKEDIKTLHNLSVVSDEQQKYGKAENHYLIDKVRINALNNLAVLYADQQKYEEAENYYLQAIEKGNIDALYNLAVLYADQQKYEEAENYYSQAIDKGDIGALNNLAVLYADQQKYEEAENYYLQAIDKGDIGALNNLAFLYYTTNKNKEKALDYSNKACETSTDIVYQETQLIIEIWNGLFKNIENRAIAIIKSKNNAIINNLIIDLLVQQQKNMVLGLFQNPKIADELQEKYSILYYVTLILNKVQDDNLLLRIPPEIQSTIDDVLANIGTQQKLYGYL